MSFFYFYKNTVISICINVFLFFCKKKIVKTNSLPKIINHILVLKHAEETNGNFLAHDRNQGPLYPLPPHFSGHSVNYPNFIFIKGVHQHRIQNFWSSAEQELKGRAPAYIKIQNCQLRIHNCQLGSYTSTGSFGFSVCLCLFLSYF